MYFVGSVQPDWPNARNKGYAGTFLTKRRKLALVRDWYVKYPALPLCIEHADADHKDFVVPPELVVGYVTGLFLDRHNNLCVTGYVFDTRPEAVMLLEGMLIRGEKWGLSAFTVFDFDTDDSLRVLDHTKHFTHVGITRNPAMAEEGSFIFEYSTNPDAIPRIMREREIPGGAVANAQSLAMWDVPEEVARCVLSILDKNISELEDPMDTGIASDSDTSSDMAANPNSANGAAAKTGANANAGAPNGNTANNNNNNNNNNKPVDPDAMDIDSPAGDSKNGQQQGQQQQQSMSPIESILAGLREAREEIEKNPSEMYQVEAMSKVVAGVNGALKENKLALQEMPRELRAIYNHFENKIMAYEEAITTELIKQGSTALDNNNNALVEKFRNELTPLAERRAIGQYVQANKSMRETMANSQKIHEDKLLKEQESRAVERRSYEEQLSKKRSLEDEIVQLRSENERLAKRRPESEALRVAAASAPSAGGYNFLGTRSPANGGAQAQQQQQQQQQPVQKQSAYSFYQAPSASEFANENFQHQYGTQQSNVSSSAPSSSSSVESQRANAYPGEKQSGFVSAAGFRLTEQENHTQLSIPADSWMKKFILPAAATSYGASKLDPVFAKTYHFLANELNRMGSSGMVFTSPTIDTTTNREIIHGYDLKH